LQSPTGARAPRPPPRRRRHRSPRSAPRCSPRHLQRGQWRPDSPGKCENGRTRLTGTAAAIATPRAGCLHLLVAAIAASTTTPYLSDAIEALRAEGDDVPHDLITHLPPVAWEPMNFLGQYTLRSGQRSAHQELSSSEKL